MIEHFVLSLLHTLWQGALLAGVLVLAIRQIPVARTTLRYVLATACLGLLVLAWLATWAWLDWADLLNSEPKRAVAVTVAAPPVQEATGTPSQENSPTPQMGTTSSVSPWPSDLFDWQWLLFGLWIIGATWGLIRLVRSIAQVGWLQDTCQPVTEAPFLHLLEDLRRQLNLHSRIQLCWSEDVVVPAVAGLFRHSILLPAAWASGTPPEYLRAVFLHELAHIRRYDYLVNILQMAIEALLFFNPFVWWLSQQIRLEREASCDALAVTVTGQRLDYARVLAELSETLAFPAPLAPPVTMGRSRGELRERVHRVLFPDNTSPVRLNLLSIAGVLVVGGLLLLGLRLGAFQVFDAWSGEERIAESQRLEADYPNYLQPPPKFEGKLPARVTLSGTAIFPDDFPIPENLSVTVYTRGFSRSNSSRSERVRIKWNRFELKAKPGRQLFFVGSVKGLAPVFLELGEVTADRDDLELNFTPGYDATLRLENEAGQPIPGVKLNYDYDEIANPGQREAISDQEGIITLRHLAQRPLKLEATHPGYQWEKKIMTLQPGSTTWTLPTAELSEALVTSTADGQPVAGAQFILGQLSSSSGGNNWTLGGGPVLATTRLDGRAIFNTLNDEATYKGIVVKPGYVTRTFGPLYSGERDLKIPLQPVAPLEIQLRNVPDNVVSSDGFAWVVWKFSLTYAQSNTSFGMRRDTKVKIHQGTGSFQLKDFWSSPVDLPVTFQIRNRTFTFPWRDLINRGEPLVLDFAKSTETNLATKPTESFEEIAARMPQREVLFQLTSPSEQPAANGNMNLRSTLPGNQQRFVDLTIINSHGKLPFPVPSRISLESQSIAGYWLKLPDVEVTSGPGPQVVTAKLKPAGSIFGQVVDPDGRPASNLFISVFGDQATLDKLKGSLNVPVKNRASPDDSGDGRFNAAPLPLNGTYYICAHRNFTYQFSPALTLTPQNPFRELRLTLPRGRDVEGQLINEAGEPIRGQTLNFSLQLEAPYGYGRDVGTTGANGGFRLPGVNFAVAGSYFIRYFPNRDYQPMRVEMPSTGKMILRAKRGLVIEGAVVDQDTGQPLAGIEVVAVARVPQPSGMGVFPSEGLTDEQGRFRFSNLIPGEFRITCNGNLISNDSAQVRAGSKELLTLRVKLAPSQP